MKESHTGIGICHCYQCRMKKKSCSTSGRISEIQDSLSNEVSDTCSRYYYEAEKLMPDDE